jgi:hypothetical protein
MAKQPAAWIAWTLVKTCIARICSFMGYSLHSVDKWALKGHGNEADFLGFLQKLVPHEALTLPFELFRFWLRIRGDIRILKTTPCYHRYRESLTPRISDTGSRQLFASLIREVANSPHHWYAESETPRITDTQSRLLKFLKENSLYQWYGEWPTPRTSDTVSRWLPVSLSRRVADSAYHRSLSQGVDNSADWWYGESLFQEKINLVLIFRTFNG